MPYSLNVPPDVGVILDELAEVLVRARDVVVDVPAREGEWTPAPGSPAERELAESTFAEDVNAYLLHLPRAVCSLYLYSGADYLASIAALLRAREVMLSPGALARAAFENGVRALLVLDPRSTARVRSARALLNEIVSAHYSRLALKHVAGNSDVSLTGANKRLNKFRDLAARSFDDVSWSGDPHSWKIEGEGFPRMNAAARSWSEWRAARDPWPSPDQGEGLYDALCRYTHPQSFASREEARWGPGVDTPYMSTDVDLIVKLALGAHTTVMDALRLLFDYHGWDVPELDEIADAASAVSAGADDVSHPPAARRARKGR